jgi:hypothetical protein
MKKSNAFFTAGLVLVILCIGLIPETNPDLHPKTRHYKNGDILLPDYACSDTLVVIDAEGLNKALDASYDIRDEDTDSLFHQYCVTN